MKKALFFLLALTVFFSCGKDKTPLTPENVDYLLVGTSSCFCFECCDTGYKLAGGQLFRGLRDKPDEYIFESAPLDSAKYAIAKVLLDEFPEELLDENGKSYQCDNCADQPIYYVELKKGGTVYHWHIDHVTDGFPDYVKTFSGRISSVLGQL